MDAPLNPKDLSGELTPLVASRPSLFANPNRVLLAEVGGRWGEYADLLKESQIHACLQVRKLALTGLPWHVEGPAGVAGSEATAIADRLRDLDLPSLMGALMDAVILGFKVAEVIWRAEGEEWIPAEIKVRPNDRFAFDAEGALMGLDGRGGAPKPLPERYKFLVATWGPRDGNRYGSGLGEMLYYLAWFKRENLKFWLIFNDKHAFPTPVGTLPEGASEDEMLRLRDRLARLRDESVIVLRRGAEVRYLEADRAGSIETFHALIEFCNAEIAKVILGQTLTTQTPRDGAGASYALGRVHNAVREDIRSGDAAWMESLMDRLLGWMVGARLGERAGRFRFRFDARAASGASGEGGE